MIQAIIGGVVTLVTQWFTNRSRLNEAKVQRDLASLKATTDYDTTAQRNMRYTIKDEYLILFHTFPIWGYGIPSEQLKVSLDSVWDKLSEAPTWWWLIYVGIVVSTFGLRFMSDRLLTVKR